MRVVIKEVRGLAEAGKLDEAQRRIPEAYKAIDKAAKRGVIKENNAARKKSRLVKFLKTKA
jgi:small subunit ribosomal protein S20